MKKLFLLMAMALPVCLFTACSSDDDEDGRGEGEDSKTTTSISNKVTEITGIDGQKVRLTSNGDFYCLYDENGYLIELYDVIYNYKITNNPFTASGSWNNEKPSVSVTGEFNKKGYFKTMKRIDNHEGADPNGNSIHSVIEYLYSFSYDANDHLIEINLYLKDNTEYLGEFTTEKDSITITYTWNNGILTEQKCKYEDYEDNGTYYDIIRYQYDKNYPNPCLQYSKNQIMGDGLLYFENICQMLGYLGKGSTQLPSSMKTIIGAKNEFDIENKYDETFFSYTFNDNGTIKSETRGSEDSWWTTWNYTYTNEVAEDEPLPHNLPMAKAAKQASSLRPLFFSKRLHRNRQK